METNDERLLIRDLSSRLPYGVKCKIDGYPLCTLNRVQYSQYHGCLLDLLDIEGNPITAYYTTVKPYLFPLSSMTEEQMGELRDLCGCHEVLPNGMVYLLPTEARIPELHSLPFELFSMVIDWLNGHYFDYNGLIGKGLAADATNLHIYNI